MSIQHDAEYGDEIDQKLIEGDDEKPTNPDDDDKVGTTWVGAVSNLANAAVGAGILAFPAAMAACGWALGTLVSIGFALLMLFTLHILGSAAERVDGKSYQDVTRRLLGGRAGLAITIIMSLYLWGACIAYTNIVADQITEVTTHVPSLKNSVLADRYFLVPMVTVFIIAPLCFLRRIEYLQYTSILAVVSVVWLEGDVIGRATEYLNKHGMHPGVKAFSWTGDIFTSFPIICFALNCHLVFVPVFAGLTKKNRRAIIMDGVAGATFLICTMLYVPTGVMGYLQYGPKVHGDILLGNLPFTWDANAARVCVAFTAIFSYPLLQFVARTAINDVLFKVDLNDPKNWRHFIGITVTFLVFTGTVSTLVKSLDTVLSVTGSTAAVIQVFIFPGWMWLELNNFDMRSRIVAGGLWVFGAAMAGLSLWATFTKKN